jgi:DNA-binding MarR family transcriptional regulator
MMRDHGHALDRILELAVVLDEDMTAGLAAYGLTRSRAHVVWELRRRGPTTQRVLADVMGTSPRNITGLVDALAATGFVTREPHPTDRRATLVTLTEHGARVAEALARGHGELARALFVDMPDERFDCLLAGLVDVLARLRAEQQRSGGRAREA